MPAREVPEKFHVAFSFAGEQRDLVRAVAEAVEKELGRSKVFFDEWFEHYIAGDNADLKLQDIYQKRCALAVVCVSARYGGKPWTQAEHAAIRARQMMEASSTGKGGQLGILPVRVGDGDVDGILFNTIAPDIRLKSVAQAAELIINRLRLILPASDNGGQPTQDWPDEPPLLRWPMADHTEARAAFAQLITRTPQWRFLPLRGPSEVGKSHITKQMLGNVLRMPDLFCGRFDFKGTTDMDAELRGFVQHLEMPFPPAGQRLSQSLGGVLDALKQRSRPTLLIFDTYEAAGEAEDWVEQQLLVSLIRAKWLRVVVAGQRVPEPTGESWEAEASSIITLKPPAPTDWFDYTKPHRPDLTLADVETACRLARNKAPQLAQMLGPAT
jgi:hypothetical protein